VDAERALLGFDHAAAGAALAERWKLPPALVDAIAHHHDPFRAAPDHAALACAAHVSEALCLTLGIGVGGDGLLFELDPAALDVPRTGRETGRPDRRDDGPPRRRRPRVRLRRR
jgi:hypothetical protein